MTELAGPFGIKALLVRLVLVFAFMQFTRQKKYPLTSVLEPQIPVP